MMKSTDLYDFQGHVSNFASGKPRVGFFVHFGGGKTYLSLKWLHTLPRPLPVLVLAKKSTLVQWKNEVEKHTTLSAEVVQGTTAQRLQILKHTQADVVIMNYDCIRTKVADYFGLYASGKDKVKCEPRKRPDFRTIILDESVYFSDMQTKRYKYWRAYIKDVPYRALLSGFAICENAEQLFGQMLMLDDGAALGSSFWTYRYNYFIAPPPWKPYAWVLKAGAAQTIAAACASKCIRIPPEVVKESLPPRHFEKIMFEFPTDVSKMYKRYKKEFECELPSGEIISTQWAITRAAKLRQFCAGFVYRDDGADPELIHEEKLEWLKENIPEMLHNDDTASIIIWTSFIFSGYLIQTALHGVGIEADFFHGNVKDYDKEMMLNNFTQRNKKVIILSCAAAHAGLNLQIANIAIFHDRDYSANFNLNAIDRNHRSGSEIHEKVTYYDLVVKDSLDEAVLEALQNKQDIGEAILKYLNFSCEYYQKDV